VRDDEISTGTKPLGSSKGPLMHYGKIAAKIFAVLAVTVSLQFILHPT
jgi:hypothetical protein